MGYTRLIAPLVVSMFQQVLQKDSSNARKLHELDFGRSKLIITLLLFLLLPLAFSASFLYTSSLSSSHGAIVAAKVVPANPPGGFDFTIRANPGTSATYQGNYGVITIYVTLLSGAQQPVTLSCDSNLPPGVSCEFGKPTSLPDFSSYLEVNTLSSTPVGGYVLKVSGTGGGVTNTIHIPLSVSVPPPVGGTIVPVEKLAILAPCAL